MTAFAGDGPIIRFPPLWTHPVGTHRGMTVFAVFGAEPAPLDYRLASDVLADGLLDIREVSSHGEVSALALDNRSSTGVLLLESEQLRGGKQNRVANLSLLVPPESVVEAPVSCIEQGRWSAPSGFAASDRGPPTRVRAALKRSVTASASRPDHRSRHRSDQAAVWHEVETTLASSRTRSSTASLFDAQDQRQEGLDRYAEAFEPVSGATGLAIGVGGALVALEVFDRPATCAAVWPRLVRSFALDAMVGAAPASGAPVPHPDAVLSALSAVGWTDAEAPGLGRQLRGRTGEYELSALCYDATPVHLGAIHAPSPAI